jgi:hypothetical protein
MKAFLLLGISFFSLLNSNAQSSKGPIFGGGFSNESFPGSNRFWFNVENAQGSDNVYTDFFNLNAGANSYTDYIHVNKFGLDIAPTAIITGIEIAVERSDPDQNTADYSVRILKYDIITGDERSTGAAYTSFDSDETFGNSGDLWGEFWTPDMINDNGFGIAIAAQRINGSTGTTNGRIDNISVTIYFTDPSTLPVSLVNLSAKKNNGSININWTTDDESGMNNYEVQRSSDGRNFSNIQSVQSRNSVSTTSYSATDSKPLNGIGYYRLKMVEVDGSATYSKIITVQFATGNLITIYPTLWKKGTTLNISNPNNEKLTAHFFNSAGQHIGISTTISSALPTSMLNYQKGIIYYRIINAGGQSLGTGNLLVN